MSALVSSVYQEVRNLDLNNVLAISHINGEESWGPRMTFLTPPATALNGYLGVSELYQACRSRVPRISRGESSLSYNDRSLVRTDASTLVGNTAGWTTGTMYPFSRYYEAVPLQRCPF